MPRRLKCYKVFYICTHYAGGVRRCFTFTLTRFMKIDKVLRWLDTAPGSEVYAVQAKLADVVAEMESRRAEQSGPGCKVPPAGWLCTRHAGHTGPCAAIPAQHQTPQMPMPNWRAVGLVWLIGGLFAFVVVWAFLHGLR